MSIARTGRNALDFHLDVQDETITYPAPRRRDDENARPGAMTKTHSRGLLAASGGERVTSGSAA